MHLATTNVILYNIRNALHAVIQCRLPWFDLTQYTQPLAWTDKHTCTRYMYRRVLLTYTGSSTMKENSIKMYTFISTRSPYSRQKLHAHVYVQWEKQLNQMAKFKLLVIKYLNITSLITNQSTVNNRWQFWLRHLQWHLLSLI